MATGEIGKNLTFPIFNSDGTSFNDLVLHRATYDSVVMSLGVKITGDVYYRGTDLPVTMGEYVEYDDIKFVLVSPPVIVREGMVSDNSELKGLTKYSFTFYHPMYMLANFPFSDVAVSNDQKKYLSSNRSFSWMGNLEDFVAKINKNLDNTQWYCDISGEISVSDRKKLSDVIAFDKNTIADVLKKGYEIWKFPYVISRIKQGEPQYNSGKRFLIRFGLPTTEIVVDGSPFVFEYGQGVGLKNNSRTPRNNKIVTRLSGYGSEDNIPYGYPQIRWYGNQSWNYTVNNNPSAANSYPIYDGILGGQKVRLIKHPFTRTHLMPSVYVNSLFNKISQYLANGNANPNYDPTLELVDYYDADNTYVNPIVADSPSYEIHEFGGIKPELQSRQISSVGTYDDKYNESVTMGDFLDLLKDFITQSQYDKEKEQLEDIKNGIGSHDSDSGSVTPQESDEDARLYSCQWSYHKDEHYAYVKYESVGQNFEYVVRLSDAMPTPDWDDTMDDDGNYVQSYFTMTLPALGFDLYACAAITQQMSINMRSGACIGCTFTVAVDWDDYKRNFYDENGDFDPVIGAGHPRNGDKYPDSTSSAITVVVQKDLNTFGTLMPNIYQNPESGDDFVILGISLPVAYVTSAEQRLDDDMKQYMRDNNVHYFDYPFKFDEAFLATHTDILQQMKPNVVVRFKYNGETLALYIKQMSIKFGDKPLPEYNITLTDDVEIVLNDIGKVSEEVSNLRILMGEGDGGGGLNDKRYLRKDKDDTTQGFITSMKGFQVGGQFITGLLGEGGVFRKDADGTTYIEADKLYIRMKAYFDTVEVRRFIHSGGNRIASAAGVKCSRVEWLTSNSEVTDNINNVAKFRCYFRANDDGKQITNDFVVNDLAYCKETNINVSQGLSQRFYWRKVVGVSSSVNADGEHYIDISKSDCLSDSDYPLAQDDIIQLGNTTDTTRQGAIVEYASGEDAPSYQIYQRINTYSLENKNYVSLGYKSDTGHAYINVYGDAFIGDPNRTTYIEYKEEGQGGLPELNVKANVTFTSPTTHQDTTLEDFATAVVGDLDSLQQQIDGSIETWFYGYVPTLSNAPASSWTTVAAKNNHLGDLFYDTTTGYAYRFANTGTEQSPVYEWLRITDTDVVKALADAAKAQDTADHKRRVFLVQPTPPYDAGDLWVNATYPANATSSDAENNQYYNEILKCVTAKGDTGQFAITDWTLASKYTDDSALINFVTNTYAGDKANLQSQIDGKAETWYQPTDPATEWTTAAIKAQHAGDLWYNTTNKTTWYYKAVTSGGTTTYSWEQQNIPQAVFDTIDGKSSIYVSKPSSYEANDIWIIEDAISSSDLPNGCVAGDIVVATSNGSSYNKAHWQKKDRYTDDSTVNAFINSYGTILGITPTAHGVGQALGYLDKVLSTGSTQIDGGLVLTNILYMKDTASTPSVRAGISGLYKSSETGTGYKGYGTAAWFGGGVSNTIPIDHEVSTSASDYAKILFRFDGSGYLAGGNITWDKNGIVTIANVYSNVNGVDVEWKGTSLQYINQMSTIFPTTLRSGIVLIDPQASFTQLNISHVSGYSFTDTSVLNRGENDARYVRIDFFNRLFQAYKSSTISDENKVAANDITTTINNLKIMVGTWTQQYLSSLGNGGGGGTGGATALTDLVDVAIGSPTNGQALVYNSTTGKWTNQTISGGGTDMATVWSNLAAATNEQINASHLSNALSGYAQTSALANYLPTAGGSLTGELITASPITINGYNGRAFGITPTNAGHNGDNVDVGWNWTDKDGAGAFFRSSDANNNPGSFGLYARNSSGTTCQLIGTPAGSLTWGGNELLTSADAGNFVTLDTAQTITGAKTFASTIYLNNQSASYTISAKDANAASRDFLKIVYTLNSDTGVQTASMTLNSYGNLTTAFAPANTEGYQRLRLGSSNKLNAANNMYGSIRLYGRRDSSNPSGTVYYGDINPDVLSANRTWTLPNKSGTIALADDFGDLFTTLTSTNTTNLTVTIGGTTKTITNLYALRLKAVQVTADTVSNGDLNSLIGTDYSVVTNYNQNSNWQHAPTIQTGNYWGGAIVVKGQDNNLMMQLFWNAKHNESTTPTGKLWFRARTAGGWGDDWKEIAFADGNIATATALATARTLWGQSFDGSANVSGNMTDVGTITGNGNITVTKTTTADTIISVTNSNGTVRLYTSADRGLYDGTSGSTGWIIATNGTNTWMSRGNVGIGTTTPEYKLHVSGVAAAQTFRSTVETGTAPMVVASSTLVTNLNADRLDGYHASDFASASDVTTLQGYFDSSGAALKAVQLKTTRTLWGQNFNGTDNVTGAMTSVGSITLTNNSRISNATGSGGSLYIGRSDDAGWVKISDMCSRQGYSYWKIKSNGDATFANVYSNGALTCLAGSSTSDARKKMIVGQVDLSVESIAKMPTVKFLWKHIPDKTVQVGTLAQSWQNVLPEAVTENNGVLGFQYGVAALLSAIVTARKVVNHEQRIAQLEKENMELRNELNKIKAA